MSELTIAITMGDPAGIGPEVIQKALADPAVGGLSRWIVAGDEFPIGSDASAAPAATTRAPATNPMAPVSELLGLVVIPSPPVVEDPAPWSALHRDRVSSLVLPVCARLLVLARVSVATWSQRPQWALITHGNEEDGAAAREFLSLLRLPVPPLRPREV